jgi:biotin/methionine sulfoxide reductase
VLQLSTGAWYDPVDPSADGSLDAHGNPNVLTPDHGTSRLAQGPSAHSALVDVERFDHQAPPVTVHTAPSVHRLDTRIAGVPRDATIGARTENRPKEQQ